MHGLIPSAEVMHVEEVKPACCSPLDALMIDRILIIPDNGRRENRVDTTAKTTPDVPRNRSHLSNRTQGKQRDARNIRPPCFWDAVGVAILQEGAGGVLSPVTSSSATRGICPLLFFPFTFKLLWNGAP